MLSEASGDKVKGLFSRTFDVNRTLVPAPDLAENASTVVSRVISGNAVLCASKSNLKDVEDPYRKNDYCFEIRSDRYRFRVFTIEFAPSHLADMAVDRAYAAILQRSTTVIDSKRPSRAISQYKTMMISTVCSINF